MPLRINEMLAVNSEEETQLMNDCIKMISTNLPERYVSNVYKNEKKKLYSIVYNLFEKDTSDVVMYLNFYLKETENGLGIMDMDVTIPNDQLAFIRPSKNSESYSNIVSSDVDVQVDRVVDRVNELIVDNKQSDMCRVSLSAMPYGEIKFAKYNV